MRRSLPALVPSEAANFRVAHRENPVAKQRKEGDEIQNPSVSWPVICCVCKSKLPSRGTPGPRQISNLGWLQWEHRTTRNAAPLLTGLHHTPHIGQYSLNFNCSKANYRNAQVLPRGNKDTKRRRSLVSSVPVLAPNECWPSVPSRTILVPDPSDLQQGVQALHNCLQHLLTSWRGSLTFPVPPLLLCVRSSTQPCKCLHLTCWLFPKKRLSTAVPASLLPQHTQRQPVTSCHTHCFVLAAFGEWPRAVFST